MTSRLLALTLTAALAGSTFLATPAAAQVHRVVQLDVQYDSTALGTAPGAATVLDSLQEQANDACRYVRPIAGAPRIDEACAADIVAKAVTKIDDASLSRVYQSRIGGVELMASAD